MRVLRRFLAMRAAHAGWPGLAVRSWASLATWWTVTVAPWSHSSHRRLRSRPVSSLRGGWTGAGAGSVMTARLSRLRTIPPKSGYQVLVALALESGLEAGPGPVAGDDFGLVAGCHRGDGGLMLGGQGLQHRCLGVPAQRGQAPDVAGEQVVVHDAPVFGCVDPDDVVVVQVQQPGPVPGFAPVPVGGALGRDHVLRDLQRDFPVDRPAAL